MGMSWSMQTGSASHAEQGAVADSPAGVWTVFFLLTVLHIYANVQAMRSLQLASLNPARLAILVQHAVCQVRLYQLPASSSFAGHDTHATYV